MTATQNAFRFQFSEDEEPSIRSAVMQALGAASTCWADFSGAGIFDSDRAKEIGEALLDFIQKDQAHGHGWFLADFHVETLEIGSASAYREFVPAEITLTWRCRGCEATMTEPMSHSTVADGNLRAGMDRPRTKKA